MFRILYCLIRFFLLRNIFSTCRFWSSFYSHLLVNCYNIEIVTILKLLQYWNCYNIEIVTILKLFIILLFCNRPIFGDGWKESGTFRTLVHFAKQRRWRQLQHWNSIQKFPHSISQVVVSIQNETKFSLYDGNHLTKSRGKTKSRNVVYVKYPQTMDKV